MWVVGGGEGGGGTLPSSLLLTSSSGRTGGKEPIASPRLPQVTVTPSANLGMLSSLAQHSSVCEGPSKFSLKQARGASVCQGGAAGSSATREVTVLPSVWCVSLSSCCCRLLFGKEVHTSVCTQTGCLKDSKQCFPKI